MSVLGDLALFLIGFLFLIKGASVLVDGAVSLAKLWKIAPWVIGVVIVGIGTSVPEFSIGAASVFSGTSLGLGAIIGGNTFNILLIIGLVSILSPVALHREWVWRDFTVNIAAIAFAALLFVLPSDSSFYGITRGEGIMLTVAFFLWIYYMVARTRDDAQEKTKYKGFTFSVSLLFILAGFIGVFLGGKWVVDGALKLADFLHIADSLLGLTLVAIGASLPELAVSLSAVTKGKTSLAIGNIIGSNIFDFLGIFGIIAISNGVPFDRSLSLSLLFLLFSSVLLWAFASFRKKYALSRIHGVVFILLYVAYILYLFR